MIPSTPVSNPLRPAQFDCMTNFQSNVSLISVKLLPKSNNPNSILGIHNKRGRSCPNTLISHKEKLFSEFGAKASDLKTFNFSSYGPSDQKMLETDPNDPQFWLKVVINMPEKSSSERADPPKVIKFSVKQTSTFEDLYQHTSSLTGHPPSSFYLSSQPPMVSVHISPMIEPLLDTVAVNLRKQPIKFEDILYQPSSRSSALPPLSLYLYLLPPQSSLQKFSLGLSTLQILTYLGRGGFSTVYLTRYRASGHLFALKIVHKHISAKWKFTLIKREFDILKVLNHPFVIRLVGGFTDNKSYYFVMEFCPGGNLYEFIRKNTKLPTNIALLYFAETLMALEYLHSRNILFRDIKTENILLTELGHIKLTDFGLAKKEDTALDLRHSYCGSPLYIAPETVDRKPYSGKIDIYASGVLLYEMLFGIPPFFNKDQKKLQNLKVLKKLKLPKTMNSDIKLMLETALEPVDTFNSGP